MQTYMYMYTHPMHVLTMTMIMINCADFTCTLSMNVVFMSTKIDT